MSARDYLHAERNVVYRDLKVRCWNTVPDRDINSIRQGRIDLPPPDSGLTAAGNLGPDLLLWQEE